MTLPGLTSLLYQPTISCLLSTSDLLITIQTKNNNPSRMVAMNSIYPTFVARTALLKPLVPSGRYIHHSVLSHSTRISTPKRRYASASSIDNSIVVPSPHITLPDNVKTPTLPDGRRMGYAEHGSPTGHPFISSMASQNAV